MPQNTPSHSPEELLNLCARAATNLYGAISLYDFFDVLKSYYNLGNSDREKVIQYFRSKTESDPGYYVESNLLVHGSISPGQAQELILEIKGREPQTKGQRKILPVKDFLRYADPSYFEETPGTKDMESLLKDEIGLASDDVKDVLTEMVFLSRSGANPTFLMSALTRRDLDFTHELDVITYGSVMDGQMRHWEDLGFTREELSDLSR